MRLELTPDELRKLVGPGASVPSEMRKIGHILRLPEGADLFVPLGSDPKEVALRNGFDCGEVVPVYVTAEFT